ncbi:hypothetical protein AALA98_12865 [Lachnospiraceae bacterium 45-W7]
MKSIVNTVFIFVNWRNTMVIDAPGRNTYNGNQEIKKKEVTRWLS